MSVKLMLFGSSILLPCLIGSTWLKKSSNIMLFMVCTHQSDFPCSNSSVTIANDKQWNLEHQTIVLIWSLLSASNVCLCHMLHHFHLPNLVYIYSYLICWDEMGEQRMCLIFVQEKKGWRWNMHIKFLINHLNYGSLN